MLTSFNRGGRNWIPKTLAICAVGAAVGFGTCLIGQRFQTFVVLGSGLFMLSVLGLAATALAALIWYIIRLVRR